MTNFAAVSWNCAKTLILMLHLVRVFSSNWDILVSLSDTCRRNLEFKYVAHLLHTPLVRKLYCLNQNVFTVICVAAVTRYINSCDKEDESFDLI